MIQCRTLGALELTDSGGREHTAVLSQPKRVAVLVYLAVSNGRGFHRRDSLLALFWPELDQEHARAALRQALTFLRHELGDDVIWTRGSGEVALNPERLWCDAVEFEDALRAGDLERALELYQGPFLAGFHVSGCGEFERWLEEQRGQLRNHAADAASRLVDRAEAAGSAAEAARWARRALELWPDNEQAFQKLLSSLDRAGDRARALREYETFAERLAADYQSEPAPETQEIAAGIRTRKALLPSGATPTAHGALTAHGAPAGASRGTRRLLIAAVGALIALTGVWLGMASTWSPTVRASRDATTRRIAVLPIRSLTDDSAGVRLAKDIHEELMAALSRLRQLRVTARHSVMSYPTDGVDARAIGSQLGVRFLLAATLQREGSQPSIHLRLLDTSVDKQLWAETYVWDRTDILSMPREAAARVAEQLQADLSTTERAEVTAPPTTNVAAYEYFLRGNEYSRASDWRSSWGPAVEMYQKAVAADPNFAMAYAALGVQHLRFYWWNRDRSPERLTRAREAIEVASRLSPDAPEVQRAWGYYYYWGHRDYARALELVQNARKTRPSDADAIFMTAALHRRLGAYSAAVKDLQEAWELDPGNYFFGQTLAETYIGLRRFPEAGGVLDELIRRNPNGAIYERHKAFVHIFWAGDTARARTILDVAERRLGRDVAHLVHARFLLSFYRGDLRAATQYAESQNLRFDLTGQQDDVYDVQRDLTRASLYALASRRDEAQGLFGMVGTKLDAAPERPTPGGRHLYYAQAYAGLGQGEEALREAALAEHSLQSTADEWERGHFMEMLLPVYVLIGEYDLAIDRIERLLATQYYEGLTVPELHLDPRLDPVRQHPRFRALVERGSGTAPARSH